MVKLPGFFQGTEMPTAGWWEALWPDPAAVLAQVGVESGMTVFDLCSGNGWFTVVGVLKPFILAPDLDHTAFIGLPVAQRG